MNIVNKVFALAILLSVAIWALVAMLFVDGHVPLIVIVLALIGAIIVIGRPNDNPNL